MEFLGSAKTGSREGGGNLDSKDMSALLGYAAISFAHLIPTSTPKTLLFWYATTFSLLLTKQLNEVIPTKGGGGREVRGRFPGQIDKKNREQSKIHCWKCHIFFFLELHKFYACQKE
jgi:hypothetical protein